MASTLITTNADALKRAARELAKQFDDLTPNRVLNTLSAAIAGPGRNWGAITGAPSGHYVQPGVHAPIIGELPVMLRVEGKFSIPFASRAQALEGFDVLASNADNKDEGRRMLAATGAASLHHGDTRAIHIYLLEAGPSRLAMTLSPLHEKPFVRPGVPLDRKVIDRLLSMVGRRKSMLICGGTGLGKSRLLEQLSHGIPKGEVLSCVEQVRELDLASRRTSYRVIPRRNDAGQLNDFAKSVRAATLMAPEWIVVGELSHGEVMQAFLEGVLTGHAGMATMHAAGIQQAIHRLEHEMVSYAQMSRREACELIGKAVDVVVYLSGSNLPAHIEAAEVRGYRDGRFDIGDLDL